jgi:hypothetical protein
VAYGVRVGDSFSLSLSPATAKHDCYRYGTIVYIPDCSLLADVATGIDILCTW